MSKPPYLGSKVPTYPSAGHTSPSGQSSVSRFQLCQTGAAGLIYFAAGLPSVLAVSLVIPGVQTYPGDWPGPFQFMPLEEGGK